MAIAENGPQGNHIGRIGNLTYYMLNGKNVVREIGVSTKPPSEAQLKTRMETKLRSGLLRKLLDFIKTGFSVAAILEADNPFNQAAKSNKQIFEGNYPDLKIAYQKLRLSKGNLKPAEDWLVAPVATGLEYSWATHPEMPWPEATDQVMMLAYFPDEEKVFFKLFGNSRLSGSDLLEIPPSMQQKYMETYISFISADRKGLSDSSYTGSFNKD
ncbi:hypothetical protein ABIE26_003771 [Pedobacter africanus]|uniref:Uncharacterized protein n=1 Tax=Pedobacter africanus TaxID=151894 RepID=A0ACC6L170_9SPHI|nr:DUF6266 family protein [Pedobacter africanus]MDR6785073.1 hypothetical protein [Pedobacter africanus]